MKIIISPAKVMEENPDIIEFENLPTYIKDTEILLKKLQNMTYDNQKKLWKTSDSLTELNRERFKNMDLYSNLSPAILTYQGNQYKHMGPVAFNNKELEYIEKNLRILSGFYGILRPLDGIRPYRLEMGSKLKIGHNKDLYDFWGDKLYKEVIDSDRLIINLASKEYEKIIKDHLIEKDRFITIVFGQLKDGKVKQNPSKSKMARGEMVRFMAERNISSIDEIKDFSLFNFSYRKDLSNKEKLVFVEK